MTSAEQSIVADTNIVSYIARGSPMADYYLPFLRTRRVIISFQTWEEALYGAHWRGWGYRRVRALEMQMEQYYIVWPNLDLIRICARLRQQRRAAGAELGVADAWVAATALYLDCPLATHDRDFIGIPDLRLITALTG